MSIASQTRPAATTSRKIEFGAFYIAVPLLIAVAFPPSWMFPSLFAMTALGLVLLWFTPGFEWRSLAHGMTRVSWPLVAVVAVAVAIASFAILWLTHPERLFQLFGEDAPRMRNGWPVIWVIALFYPLVSALPQELVFRPLFFRRYGMLMPAEWGLWINAGAFSLAHLMYWSWVVALMTFAGGLLFAWSYERRRNFPEAVILHSVAGIVLFAVGMGAYFYSGNVVRPF